MVELRTAQSLANRVTEQELQEDVAQFRAFAPTADSELRLLAVVLGVIHRLMGADWCKHHLFAEQHHFFGSFVPGSPREDTVLLALRARWLAETLYNLQDVPGFAERLRLLQHDDKDVRAAMLELRAGQWLFRAGVPFVYRPSGHEIDIDCGGLTIPLEAKLKLDETECREKSIVATLNEAREQLPRPGPGIILLGVPLQWTLLPANVASIQSAINRLFRQSTRVGAVMVSWEDFHISPIGGGSMVFQSRSFTKSAASFPPSIEPLFRANESVPKFWRSLSEFLHAGASKG